MGTLREEFEGMDPELRDLIADGNHEIAQIEDEAVTSDFEFPSATRELTAAESAAQDERISTGALIETVFGIPAENPVEVDCRPLGVNGKPLGKVATLTDEELEANICKIVKLRMEGNPEVEEFLKGNEPTRDLTTSSAKRAIGAGSDFAKRMLRIAEEQGSPMVGFLRGYVQGSNPAMRAAVRHLLMSEAGSAGL
jgi:hypothetical protein